MKRTAVRLGAATAATALVMLSSAPAHAATVSQASASALQVGVGGTPAEVTGEVVATNDGTGETVTGETNPPVSVLQNQALVNVGVLAQETTARVTTDGDGNSAACAGVAGNGGAVVGVGESQCITPGDPVGIILPNLDLTGVEVIDPASALGALAPLNAPLEQILAAITVPLTEALAPLEDTGLAGSLGAVEARCVAVPGTATGFANIVDTRLTLNVAGTEVVLAELPVNPAPNTNVLLDTTEVLNTIIDALRVNFANALDGVTDPAITPILDPIQDQLVNGLLDQALTALAPLTEALNENVLELILNKQTTGDNGASIDVTAISLRLLPGAEEFGVDSLLNLQIGNVSCGPNGTYEPPTDTPEPPVDTPDIPTKVTSGVASESSSGVSSGAGLLAVLLALGTAAGVVGFRRSIKL